MDTRRATEGPAGVLDSTARSPTERNAVDMPGSAAAVESLREMRAKAASFIVEGMESAVLHSWPFLKNEWTRNTQAMPKNAELLSA